MAISGLLVAEANLYVRQQQNSEAPGLLATIAHLLGQGGAIAAGILYVFMHYALLVAYTARGGDILAMAARNLAWLPEQAIPLWWGHVLFAVLLASLLYLGTEAFVGHFNSVLLGGIIAAFGGLVVLTGRQLDTGITTTNTTTTAITTTFSQAIPWQAIGTVIPVMLVAFVFHNIIPVITRRLAADKPKIRQSILLGSFIPLVMFLVWNAVILLSVGNPSSGSSGDPLELLRQGLNSPRIGLAISIFSELAVATSFIGFVYGLLSFLEDALPANSVGKRKPAKFALVFLPPLVLSVLSPTIFFDAIEVAGAFGVSVLFGMLPAVMVWKMHYGSNQDALTEAPVTKASVTEAPVTEALVPGRKGLLVAMAGGAIAIFSEQALQIFTH